MENSEKMFVMNSCTLNTLFLNHFSYLDYVPNTDLANNTQEITYNSAEKCTASDSTFNSKCYFDSG